MGVQLNNCVALRYIFKITKKVYKSYTKCYVFVTKSVYKNAHYSSECDLDLNQFL